MSETTEQTPIGQQTAPNAKKLFLVPNILNLIAALCVPILLVLCLTMPLIHVGAPEGAAYPGHDGKNEVSVSALDVITGISGDEDVGVLDKDAGNFDKAINLLYLQSMADYQQQLKEFEAAGTPAGEEPQVPPTSRFEIIFNNIGFVILPFVLLISAIFWIVKIIKAAVRMVNPKPYPKMGGNGTLVLVVPIAVVLLDVLFDVVSKLLDAGALAYEYPYYGYEITNMIVVAAAGAAVLVVDIVAWIMAKKTSAKHYPK